MRITVLFKYLSQKNIHTHRTTTRKKKQHSEQIFGVIFLFLKGGYTTHKKENMYIYLQKEKKKKSTNRDMKREKLEMFTCFYFYGC
jgi:hypothetical protein